MSSFAHNAGTHAAKASDSTYFPAEYERNDTERIADALESIAHSLLALTLMETTGWDPDSPAYEDFREGWNQ